MQEIINENKVWYCLDCGKCGAVCPITRWETQCFTSPRLLVEMATEGSLDEMRDDPLFWSCLTCKQCSQRCPSGVNFVEFVRSARGLARQTGCAGECTHGDMMKTWAGMMTNPKMKQNRLDWLDDDLNVAQDSDTVYFVGCLPYYDALFKRIGTEGVEIAQAAIKILNHLGIEPIVMADERCCGHDQLWGGDAETFTALAEINLQHLRATGAKRIVTTCPECAHTLKVDYPKYVGEHGLEIVHLSELLANNELPITTNYQSPLPVTYHDPCRLGRHMGVYDQPRAVITELGFELNEMNRSRQDSLCCGTICWTNCGQVSKNIQVERLQEAKATGADMLITACVKCQIHLKCAQDDPVLGDLIEIEIRDLTTLAADLILVPNID